MYPTITPEMTTAAAEMLIYLVTVFVAVFSYLWTAHA